MFLLLCFLFGLTAFADISWLRLIDFIGASTLKFIRYIGGESVGAVQKAVELNKNKKESIAEKAKALVNVPALVDLRLNSDKSADQEPEDAILIDEELRKNGKTKQKSGNRKLKKVEPVMSEAILADSEPVSRSGKKQKGSRYQGKVTGTLPGINVLDLPKHSQTRGFTDDYLEKMSRLLEEKLKDFGVIAEVVGVCPGPVITRFEIQPCSRC